MVLTWYELLLFGSVVNLAFSLQAVPDSFETQPRDFGMNKPHLIFHLGTRYPFSVNYGNGYWLKQIVDDKGQYKQFFSYPRFKYDNTKDGLYIDMIVHNGDSLARQTLSDTKSGVQGDFSYQLLDEPRQWQHQINLRLSKSNNTFGKSLYWFNYMSV